MFLFEAYGRLRVNDPDDEFYTRLLDCEKEYAHYNFSGKTIYCCCDNPAISNIYKYFYINFHKLGLRGLYDSFYELDRVTKATYYNGTSTHILFEKESCSFEDLECQNLMDKADIIVTNPPFGKLVINFLKLMVEKNKKFIAVVPYTVVTNPYIIKYFNEGKLLSGYNYIHTFTRPDGSSKGAPVFWCTNINYHNHPNLKRDKECVNISDEGYRYVSTYKNLPTSFDGEIIVPLSYITYYDPDKYKIINHKQFKINGKTKHGLIIEER